MVMKCVSTVSYKVAHNGKETGPIKPKRGLRQGDPLSLYLVILCVEGLMTYLNDLERQCVIHGCKIARTTSVISHLIFVDDNYLFFRANMKECTQVRTRLQIYEEALGQRVNFEKSAIMFNLNTTVAKPGGGQRYTFSEFGRAVHGPSNHY